MNQIKNILYLGWLGKGNVGDDVLFELFKTMFYKYHKSKDNSIVNIDAHPSINNYKIDLSFYDLIVLGGGSLFNISYYIKICAEGIKNQIPIVTWGTGVDGFFKNEDLKSIKLNDNNPNYKEILDKFNYISVRGPFTKKMLRNLGVSNKIHEIGDPALIYSNELIGKRIVKQNTTNKNILINWGTSYNNIFGKDEYKVEQILAETIRKLISRGFKITVYPIWTEDIEPVKRLVQTVNNDRCQALTEVYEAKILQNIISQSYITINLKLHANILSASANRPFISLAYRGKCFDFADTVNCSKFTIATDEITSNKILNLVEDIELNYSHIVSDISKAKNKFHPEIIKSIETISEIINNQEPKRIQNYNKSFNVFYEAKDIKIIKMVRELSETVIDGLDHILKLISQGDFNKTVYLFEDVCEAFLVIESSLKGIQDVFNDDNIVSSIETIKNTLQKSVNAYEDEDTMKLEYILLSDLKNEFKYLHEYLQEPEIGYLN